MPIIKAAIKDLRKSEKRRHANRIVKRRLKESLKMIEKLAAAKKMEELAAKLPEVTSLIDKAVKKHLIHRNNGARKKSRLSQLASPASK